LVLGAAQGIEVNPRHELIRVSERRGVGAPWCCSERWWSREECGRLIRRTPVGVGEPRGMATGAVIGSASRLRAIGVVRSSRWFECSGPGGVFDSEEAAIDEPYNIRLHPRR